MEQLTSFLHPALSDFLNLPVFPSGKHGLSLGTVIHVSILLAILVYFTRRLKGWLIERVLSKTSFDLGFRYTLGAILSYAFLIVGLLIVLDTAGVDTTALTVVAGALGLGVSLSLQTIISNCFAGLYILLERRIKVGDKVQIADLVGHITDVSLRASSLLTSENTLVIVPNSDFISSRVIKLNYDNADVRVSVPVTLDWQDDPDLLMQILNEAAAQVPGALKDRTVEVLLRSFSKKERTLTVSVWTHEYAQTKEVLQSNLNMALLKALSQYLTKQTSTGGTGN